MTNCRLNRRLFIFAQSSLLFFTVTANVIVMSLSLKRSQDITFYISGSPQERSLQHPDPISSHQTILLILVQFFLIIQNLIACSKSYETLKSYLVFHNLLNVQNFIECLLLGFSFKILLNIKIVVELSKSYKTFEIPLDNQTSI